MLDTCIAHCVEALHGTVCNDVQLNVAMLRHFDLKSHQNGCGSYIISDCNKKLNGLLPSSDEQSC